LGCHRLIRDGARLVETAAEIVEVLAPAAVALGRELAGRLQGPAVASPQETASEADPSRRALLDALGYGPVALEDLAGFTGKTVADLTSALLMLELDGQVEALPGNRYQRLRG
jgi:DNA processing protein